MTTTTTTTGAADLPEALRSIQRFEVVDCIDDKHVPAVIPKPHGPWVRYEDHIAALAAGQATAAQQGVAYADAHGAIMGAAYDFRDAHISGSPNQKRSAHAALESAVTHALRASHGQAPAGAGMGHTDGGRNMFYEGRFDGESQREQQARLRWANDMRAAFERHTGNGWFDKDWRTETGLWSSAWHACLAAQPTTTAQAADSVQEDANCAWSNDELTAIYNEANGITVKNPPITTERIFAAMRRVAQIAARAAQKEGEKP